MSRSESLKKHRYTILGIGILGIFIGALLLYVLPQRRPEHVREINSPGDGYVEVYSTRKVTQQVYAPSTGISGFAFLLPAKEPLPPKETSLIISVLSAVTGEELRKISASVGELLHEDITRSSLRISFPLLPKTKENLYAFSIQAPTLTKYAPLKLAYQIDAISYTRGELLINKNKRIGSLGFLVYERPTVLASILRWMRDGEHRAIWLGLVLTCTGIILFSFFKNTVPKMRMLPQPRFSRKELGIASVLILFATMVIFLPSLSLFFVQDDIPILLRAKNMSSVGKLIFTNQPFIPEGGTQGYPIGFYRPITYSFFPWIMYQLFGLSAGAHHAIHLLLFTCLAILIYRLSRLFGPPLFAASTLGLWLVHSSKISVVYWLSSSQDVISSVFFLLALLLYIRHRTGISKTPLSYACLLYIGALFSKDFSILLPCILILFELYEHARSPLSPWKSWLKSQCRIQAPFIIISGIYLIVRTIALGDPLLPPPPFQDHSYDIGIQGISIAQNILAYTHWTAEYTLWPQYPIFGKLLETNLQQFMTSTRLTGPFYPGLLLIAIYLVSLIALWKRKRYASRSSSLEHGGSFFCFPTFL